VAFINDVEKMLLDLAFQSGYSELRRFSTCEIRVRFMTGVNYQRMGERETATKAFSTRTMVGGA